MSRDDRPPLVRYELVVTGMTCTNCEAIVREALATVDGVVAADPRATAERVVVRAEPGTYTAARAAVAGLGFEVES
jgi:copper chaperone CopZ